jgi:signal transduction histidine kinase
MNHQDPERSDGAPATTTTTSSSAADLEEGQSSSMAAHNNIMQQQQQQQTSIPSTNANGSITPTTTTTTTTVTATNSRPVLVHKQSSIQSFASTTSNRLANNINSIVNSIANSPMTTNFTTTTTTTTNSPPNTTHTKQTNKDFAAARRTWVLRSLLIFSLLVAVSVCASLSYIKLRDTEALVGRQTYESIAASALLGAQSITRRKVQGSEVMATLLSHTYADIVDWPFISMKGYIPIAEKVAAMSSSIVQALMVVHHPLQTEAFENHTYQLYREQGRPMEAGVSDFGFGVWKPLEGGGGGGEEKDDASPSSPPYYEDGRVHDTTGVPSWGGTRTLMTTIMMHNDIDAPSLMYNTYSEANRGVPIDGMMNCIEQGGGTLAHTLPQYQTASGAGGGVVVVDGTGDSTNKNNNMTTSPSCGVITDILELKSKPGPAGLIFVPIFPANNPDIFVGFATTSLHWDEVLTNIVPNYVNGLTCVVSTGTQTVTFEIRGGEPILLGDGDLHDVSYTHYGQSVILNEIETNTDASAVYTLTVYPNYDMIHAFSSNSPKAVAWGFFGAIAGCTMIFFLYDFLMRRQHDQRKEIMEVKRRFVRFISHEMRTPLNTVCMGLELLESELSSHRSSPTAKKIGLDATSTKSGDAYLMSNLDTSDNSRVSLLEGATTNTTLHPGDDKVVAEDVDFWHNVIVDINENAYVAVSILNDLLNYDKLESGSLKMEQGIVNVWDLLERTVNQFRIQAVNKKVDLKLTMVSPDSSVEDRSSVKKKHQGDNMEAISNRSMDTHSCFDLWNVWGDHVRLSQVIRNVLSNALKFTPVDGLIEVTITHVPKGLPDAKLPLGDSREAPSLQQRAGSAMITIKDSGVGLTKDQLKQLFGEGVQFDANKLQHGGGSGLGLCIAKGIIEQHGATIRAESDGQDKGTSLIVEIPLYEFSADELHHDEENAGGGKTDDTAATAASSANLGENSAAGGGGGGGAAAPAIGTESSSDQEHHHHHHHRVLIAEDAESSRKMLTRLLERAGHRCVPACNGHEAVLAIQRDMELVTLDRRHVPIDTVLMDYEMPVLNGPDASKAIRSIGYKGIILGVTGNVLLEDVEFFKDHGANEVLSKPIRYDIIKAYWDHKHGTNSGMRLSNSATQLNDMGH